MAEPGQGAQIAAQSLFTASSAVNAIPVAGQFASAGLALVGGLVKIFGGRRRAKRAAARRRREAQLSRAAQASQPQARASQGVGLAPQPPIGTTAPVTPPPTPSFSSFGGGSAPSVQPPPEAQQTLK